MWEYRARIDKVVDGDTIDVALDLGLDVGVRTRLRLAAINAPETSTEPGRLARDYVVGWVRSHQVSGGWFTVRTAKDRREKYGRYLATVTAPDGADLGADLVAAGHALPWDGHGPRPTQGDPQ
jgi:micrococcal nuclease